MDRLQFHSLFTTVSGNHIQQFDSQTGQHLVQKLGSHLLVNNKVVDK